MAEVCGNSSALTQCHQQKKLMGKTGQMTRIQKILLVLGAAAVLVVIFTAPRFVEFSSGRRITYDPERHARQHPEIDLAAVGLRTVAVLVVTGVLMAFSGRRTSDKDAVPTREGTP